MPKKKNKSRKGQVAPINKSNGKRRRRKRGNGSTSAVGRNGGVAMERTSLAPVSFGFNMRQMGSSIDAMRFHHTETLTDVYGTADFTVLSVPCNPGLPSTFSWLSQLAPLWETYSVNNFKIHYVPATSTSTPGSVLIGFDYDTYDSNPASFAAFMMTADACASAPWQNCTLDLKSRDLKRRGQLYVRTGAVNGDRKTYDLGKIFWATQANGAADQVIIGQLYMTYDITFYTPQPLPPPTQTLVAAGALEPDKTPDRPFGSAPQTYTIDNLVWAYNSNFTTSSVFSCLRSGQYFVFYDVVATSFTSPGINFANDVLSYTGNSASFDIQDYYSTWDGADAIQYAFVVTASDGDALQLKATNGVSLVWARVTIFPAQDILYQNPL